jgi:hypothetical protein
MPHAYFSKPPQTLKLTAFTEFLSFSDTGAVSHRLRADSFS